MQRFGLIGRTLKHSYSKPIHNKLGDYGYELVEIEPEELKSFTESASFNGYNVTIPYKKDIIPYLDSVSSEALAIGAVNTVVKRAGKLYGYNTDFKGMIYMLDRAGISVNDKVVMILGTGGTSNTATAVCKHLNAKKIVIVSRSGKVNYDNCYDIKDIEIIINTTPVGMFPNTDKSPVDLSRFDNLCGVVDVIYNPSTTKLLYQAKELGVPNTNGLAMLVAQAKYAMEHFTSTTVSDSVIEKVILEMQRQMENIVLIGMPSSGKSSIGKRVAEALGREFIDIDAEIERAENKSIPQIFAEHGEEYFRKIEKQITQKLCALSSKVISTGGGVVKDRDNLFSLKQNGKVVLITRDIEKLVSEGRPLSKDKESIKRLYKERKDLYNLFADIIVANDGELDQAVKGVIKAYENFSY